jgi:hypothetical protein
MDKLNELLNNAASNGEHPQQVQQSKPEPEKTDTDKTSGKKRATNRSITCSEDIRNRIKLLSAKKHIPMQTLIEDALLKVLETEGL